MNLKDPVSSVFRQRWAVWPIPLLVALMAGLWIADPRVVWPLPSLHWLVHYGSVALGITFIVLPAARSFLANGQASVLMLGCGVLVMDIGAAAMPTGFARSSDTAFAIYSTAVLLSALCHLTGVTVTARRKLRLRPPAAWLTATYAGGMVVMGLVIWGAFSGRMPVFFIEGQGGTLLRSLVVGTAVAFFVLTAGLLWQTNRRAPSPFLYWYALGLVLLAAGLAGSLLIAVTNCPLQWVTRSTQFLGGVYMCVAALASARESSAKGIPLAAVEEAWRARAFLAGPRGGPTWRWFIRYGAALAAVIAGYWFRVAMEAWEGPGLATYLTFYPAVMAVALLAGFGPGLLATVFTGLVAAFWVLPPEGFAIDSPVDRLGLVLFSGMGLFMSTVAEFYRRSRGKAAAYDREAALRESREELRQQREWLRVTLTSIGDAVVVTDTAGCITFLNPVAQALTGWTEEGALGRPIQNVFRVINEETRAPLDPIVERVLREGCVVTLANHTALLARDGREVAIEDSAAPIRDAAGQVSGVVLVFHDVGEKRRAQQALRESESRLRQLNAELEQRVAAQTAEIRRANETLEQRITERTAELQAANVSLHASRQAALNLMDDAVKARREAEQTSAELQREVAERERAEEEIRRLNADLERRLADLEAANVELQTSRRAAINLMDDALAARQMAEQVSAALRGEVAERRRAEEALRESQQDLSRAQAVAHIGSWRLDVRKNKLHWSDETYRIFGIPVGTPLTYETFLNAVHPEDRELVDEAWQAGLRGEPYDCEHRIVVGHTVRWVREKAELELDAQGGIIGGFGTAQDVTERKEAERRLERQNRTLTALGDSSQAMMRARDEAEYLGEVCRIVVEHCGHAMVWVGYAEDDEAKSVSPVAWAGFDDGYVQTLDISWGDTDQGRGPTGTAIRTGKVSLCRNMLTDPNFGPWRQEALKRGYASSIVLPLMAEGRPFGALNIYAKEADPFSEDEVGLLTELANDLAYGVTAIRLRRAAELAEQELREAAEHRRLALEAGDLGTWEYRYTTGDVFWDERCRRMWGIPEGDRIDYAAAIERIHPEDRAGVEEALRRAIAGDDNGAYHREFRVAWPDGTVRWIASHGRVSFESQGTERRAVQFIGVNQDITERKRAEQAVVQAARRFEILSETASELLQSEDPQKLVETLCRKVMEHLDCHVFVNYLIDEEVGRLHLNASAGMPDQTTKAIEWLDFGQAICGRVAQEGKRIVAENIQESCDSRADLVRSFGIRAYACHPIIALNRVVGTLSFGTRSRGTFTDDDLAVMKTVTDQVATAMQRMRAQQALQELNEQLEQRVQKRTAELRQASAYNRSLIEASLDPMVTIDADGKITDLNSATEKATGRSREKLIGTDFSDYFTEPERARAGYRQVFREGSVQDYPLEIRHQEGRKTPVLYNASLYRDEAGQVLGMFAAARDITAAKAAEQALRLASAYNRSLIEASLDPLVTIDTDGKITDVNAATEKATGRSRQELIGTDFSDYFTQPDRARAGYLQVFRDGWVQDYSLDLRHRDGHHMPVVYNASVYRDNAGKVIGVFAAARDITELKRAEEDLRRLNDELEQRVIARTAELAASNRELEAFAYSVSHDLRAPLRAMDGFSQALLEDYADRLDREAQGHLHRVRAASQRMGELIDGILNLSRMTRSEMRRTEVDLSAIAQTIAGELHKLDPERPVEFVIEPRLVVNADANLLRIMMENLLGNAWKFTSKHPQARIEVGAVRHGSETAYFVRDDGAGFDATYAHNLFGAFRRLHTESEFEGTGIGLATVQRIVHRHGGRVWAEGQVEKGATFCFTLPA